MTTDKYTKIDKSRACLILGAIGDALGAPVEFMKKSEIAEKYGEKGIVRLDRAYGKTGAVTDDTQMTLFTADSLINAHKRGKDRGILGEYWTYSAFGYVNWAKTQGVTNSNFSSMIISSSELYELVLAQGKRAPGNTCLSSLASMPNPPEPAQNDSKGCGTVMRVAPVGIFFGNLLSDHKEHLSEVYKQGMQDAAITHGHETAHHASGILAVIVALCLHGRSLNEAVGLALGYFGTPDITEICSRAVKLSESAPSAENLDSLGGGWIAEEALAISIYCSLQHARMALTINEALALAVNHDGDSDSTGSITGNLIGISSGTKDIPDVGDNTEVGSIMKLLRDYGESLIEVADYDPKLYGPSI